MPEATGRFSQEQMRQVMQAVAAQIGTEADDVKLLRLTNNAVYALPSAGVVIRITRSTVLHDRVIKTVQLGRWFDEVDAPTIRLAGPRSQPITVQGLWATVWHYVPSTSPPVTTDDLGRVLQEFHRLGLPPFALPAWDPIGDARLRLRDAEGLQPAHFDALTSWCDRLEPRIDELRSHADATLVHGDAHLGNLLRNDHGRVLLCDFDPTCIGPWQADLVAVPVGEARFHRPGGHAKLSASYGYDVTTDPDWPVLREARELKMVVAAVPLLASSGKIAEEFENRLLSILRQDFDARWTPFAEL